MGYANLGQEDAFRTDFEGLYIDVSVRNRLIGLTNQVFAHLLGETCGFDRDKGGVRQVQ